MQRIRVSWVPVVTAIFSIGLSVASCGQAVSPSTESMPQSAASEQTDQGYISLLPLANEQYSIVEMATAHGAFTIEVEIAGGADTQRIARGLIEPVQDQYAEVLVYFYGREGDRELPLSRIQWTADRGYVEIHY